MQNYWTCNQKKATLTPGDNWNVKWQEMQRLKARKYLGQLGLLASDGQCNKAACRHKGS